MVGLFLATISLVSSKPVETDGSHDCVSQLQIALRDEKAVKEFVNKLISNRLEESVMNCLKQVVGQALENEEKVLEGGDDGEDQPGSESVAEEQNVKRRVVSIFKINNSSGSLSTVSTLNVHAFFILSIHGGMSREKWLIRK